MKSDKVRLKRYLTEITLYSDELRQLVAQNDLIPASIPLKAAKYISLGLAEAMSNTPQHILAKEKGIAVSGYIDTIVKGNEYQLISKELFDRLKPFFDFRNSLIHRYWTIDDSKLIKNILQGREDFDRFVKEIDEYLKKLA